MLNLEQGAGSESESVPPEQIPSGQTVQGG